MILISCIFVPDEEAEPEKTTLEEDDMAPEESGSISYSFNFYGEKGCPFLIRILTFES